MLLENVASILIQRAYTKESASRDLDFLVTSQGPIELLVQATKTILQETSNRI